MSSRSRKNHERVLVAKRWELFDTLTEIKSSNLPLQTTSDQRSAVARADQKKKKKKKTSTR